MSFFYGCTAKRITRVTEVGGAVAWALSQVQYLQISTHSLASGVTRAHRLRDDFVCRSSNLCDGKAEKREPHVTVAERDFATFPLQAGRDGGDNFARARIDSRDSAVAFSASRRHRRQT